MTGRPKIKEKMTLGGIFQKKSTASFRLLKIDPYFVGMSFQFFSFSRNASMRFLERLHSFGKV